MQGAPSVQRGHKAGLDMLCARRESRPDKTDPTLQLEPLIGTGATGCVEISAAQHITLRWGGGKVRQDYKTGISNKKIKCFHALNSCHRCKNHFEPKAHIDRRQSTQVE